MLLFKKARSASKVKSPNFKSGNITYFGETGLNISTHASTNLEKQVSESVRTLCRNAKSIANGRYQVKCINSVTRSIPLIRSPNNIIFDRLRLSLLCSWSRMYRFIWERVQCWSTVLPHRQRLFQVFYEISLLYNHIWKARGSQTKTFIREASHGIWYQLQIKRQRWTPMDFKLLNGISVM